MSQHRSHYYTAPQRSTMILRRAAFFITVAAALVMVFA